MEKTRTRLWQQRRLAQGENWDSLLQALKHRRITWKDTDLAFELLRAGYRLQQKLDLLLGFPNALHRLGWAFDALQAIPVENKRNVK